MKKLVVLPLLLGGFQLFFDGERYFVTHIFWSAESMGFPLPEKYLSK